MIKAIATTNPFQPPVAVAEARIVPRSTHTRLSVRPVTLPAGLVKVFRPVEHQPPVPLPKLPPPKSYSAQHASGWVSRLVGHNLIDGRRLEIELPIKTPRYTNGATLKVMLGARKSDLLLREEKHTWVICENDSRIDLLDRTVRFKVGPVAVYS
jgi:hypothetical protein